MTREILTHYGLIFHVTVGMIGFFVAPAAMLTVKGGLWHRRWGKIYFWAMTAAAISAVLLSTMGMRQNLFLTFIGIFSFYLSYSGYRVLYQKRPAQGQGPKPYDWAMAMGTAIAGSALVLLGVTKPSPMWAYISTVAIALGGACVITAAQDIHRFLKPPADKNFWWYSHMAGMLGSYIAATTAFLVNNALRMHFPGPVWIWWLLPTAVGVPAIAIWTRSYRKKFNKPAQPVPASVNAAFTS
jgi:uncharacterized membrane protein